MKIQLKEMTLINFKGQRNKTIQFNADGETFIFGNNATGKTTIFDAFTWLLFGKDSAGRSDFEIKTLDENGQAIEKIDHEVTGQLIVDGKAVEIKRIFREKWVKKRGSETTEFEGNETLLFVNDVPKKANEFKDYINSIINESLFKLITSPTAFNSLKWEERRNILNEISGAVSNDEVIASMEIDSDRKQWLLNMLASDKSIADHKKEIGAKVKALKDEIKTIPTRVDEVDRNKPDLTGINLSEVDKLESLGKEIISIDSQIADKSKAVDAQINSVNVIKGRLVGVQSAISKRENEIRAAIDREVAEVNKLPRQIEREINILKSDIQLKQSEINRSNDSINSISTQIDSINRELERKRAEWAEVNAKQFTYDPTSLCCPTCKQELRDKDSKIEQLKANFNTKKSNQLEAINSQGGALKNKLISLQADKERVEKTIQDAAESINQMTTQLDIKSNELKSFSVSNPKTTDELFAEAKTIDIELISLQKQEIEITQEIEKQSALIGNVDNSELLTKKTEIFAEIERIKSIKQKIDEVAKADKRIKELKSKEKELAHSQAMIERDEFLINKFTKATAELIEAKANSMFAIVNFKMFEQQINGGEVPTCVCMVNGVPYPDLNNAMKIQAGLDIITTLSRHYKVSAPIFIDNRESVVHIDGEGAQIINLVVSPNDNQLRVV